jgi:hypothetical protein
VRTLLPTGIMMVTSTRGRIDEDALMPIHIDLQREGVEKDDYHDQACRRAPRSHSEAVGGD